jgi:hypothetical protein
MSNTGSNDSTAAQFAVEIDGNRHSEHVYFADAMKIALLLRQTQPHSKIKVRDLVQIDPAQKNPEMAA